jgi:hypothetical protein
VIKRSASSANLEGNYQIVLHAIFLFCVWL